MKVISCIFTNILCPMTCRQMQCSVVALKHKITKHKHEARLHTLNALLANTYKTSTWCRQSVLNGNSTQQHEVGEFG